MFAVRRVACWHVCNRWRAMYRIGLGGGRGGTIVAFSRMVLFSSLLVLSILKVIVMILSLGFTGVAKTSRYCVLAAFKNFEERSDVAGGPRRLCAITRSFEFDSELLVLRNEI